MIVGSSSGGSQLVVELVARTIYSLIMCELMQKACNVKTNVLIMESLYGGRISDLSL